MSSKLAMQFCIRYDEEMLVPHLKYHQFLGVSKVYAYLDQCNQRALDILRAFDFVECIAVDACERQQFGYVPHLQLACMNDALKRARRDGFDWLMSIDIDEFALPDNCQLIGNKSPSVVRNSLVSMLDQIEPHIDVIMLSVKEVVPFYCNERFEFWRQHYFQDQKPLSRELLNVETGETRKCAEFMSHNAGKSIARTSASIQSHGPHGWVKDQGKDFPLLPFLLYPQSAHCGFIYHYFAFQNSHFQKKFKLASKEPSLYTNGEPVAFPRQCLKAASANLRGAKLVAYLQQYLYRQRSQLEELVHQQSLEYDDTVEKILRYLQVLSSIGRLKQRMKELLKRSVSGKKIETARLLSDVDQQELTLVEGRIYWGASMWPVTLCSGFFLPELFDGRCLRWASPVAQLKLRLKPSKYRLALDFGGLIDESRMTQISIEWNQSVPAPSAVSACEGRLYFDVNQTECEPSLQILTVRCPALDTSNWPLRELRQLSIPLFGVEVALKS